MHQTRLRPPEETTRSAEQEEAQNAASAERRLIASYNIHKCVGVDGRFDPIRITRVIEEIDADLIALQEADQRFGKRAGLLDLDHLHDCCGLVPVQVGGRPHSHGWRGNVLLVREHVVHEVSRLNLPSVEPRGALVVDLDFNHFPLRVIAAHLGLLRQSRRRQAKALVHAALHENERPTVLLGDLNEWRVGRRSALQALDPVFGPIHAVVPSFPSRYPVLALDRILANPSALISDIRVHNTPTARVASDHLPVKAWITLRR